MRHERVVHVLEEERGRVEGVEGDAVGEFDQVELFFLGEDVLDVGFEEGEGVEDFGADGALGAGFYFGLCAGGDAAGGGLVGGEGGGSRGRGTLS